MPSSLKSTLAGIFFLALSVILFEIALTRVFAIMMWHHFTYMVISIGLLGFGASGSLLTATRIAEKPGSVARALTLCSAAYGISIVAAFLFATLVRLDSLAIWKEKENFVALFFIYLIIGVPFLLGGFGIGLALTRLVSHVNKLYFADLVGSAVGAGVSVWLLRHVGSTAAVVMAGCFGLVASFCFGFGAERRHRLLGTGALLLAGVLAIGFCGGGFGVPALRWRVPFAPGKEGSIGEALGYQIDRFYSATAEVQVGPDVLATPAIGGDNGSQDLRTFHARTAAQDGTAPTMLYKDASHIEQFPFLDDTQAASAYIAHRSAGREGPRVMVIGVGGGVDVMVALANGAKKVTAVELNTAMIDMVTGRYDEYLGGLFRPGGHPLADRVELVNSEGRSYLRTHDTKYDVIQMSGVDSYTALSTGAYTLSESYLYTTQAVQDFYAHLTDDGIVNYSRFIMARPMKPRETLRLANIAYTALQELGVADPASHIAVFQGTVWASTMIKRSPFRADEIEGLRQFARLEGFFGLVFNPLHAQGAPFPMETTHFAMLRDDLTRQVKGSGAFATDAAVAAAVDHLIEAAVEVLNGKPVDESLLPPSLREGKVGAGAMQMLRESHDSFSQQEQFAQLSLADFASVLRNTPEGRAKYIAEYDYDISPATDDKPFFFNYYRYSNLFQRSQRGNDPSLFRYHTDYPVGHMVLLASMLQIVLLAGLLIFLPLRKLARDGLRTKGVWRYFGYFAALGMGFMFLEIALMQKMVIFLGHPTYALSIVLVSLLGSAGVGSLLAGRIREVEQRHLARILAAIVAVLLFDALAVNWLLPMMLGFALEVRMAVVVLLLLPTGLVLGMPFPTGMRIVEKQCPHLLPWGWAVNAFFSVFASIFCIVLSMAIGFTNVLLVSIGIYVAGLLGLRVNGSATGPATGAP